jgi:hypothetical protein
MIKLLLKIFGSKINWAALLLILSMVKEQIMNLDFTGMTWQQASGAVIGVLIMILRTFFNTPEKKLKELQAKAAQQGVDIEV